MNEKEQKLKLPKYLIWLHVAGTALAAIGIYGLIMDDSIATIFSKRNNIILISIGCLFVAPSIIYLFNKHKAR
jgi:hypothetical protein